MKDDLEILLHKMATGKWEHKLDAGNALAKEHGILAVPGLCDLLKSRSAETMNAAALTLRDLRDNRAVEPLFEAINAPENQNNRSTLVYALEELDCRYHFLDIVKLTLSKSPDVQLAAMNVLFSQGFMVSDEKLAQAYSHIHAALEEGEDEELIRILESRLADFTK